MKGIPNVDLKFSLKFKYKKSWQNKRVGKQNLYQKSNLKIDLDHLEIVNRLILCKNMPPNIAQKYQSS